jgi:hypothetical protein
MATFVIGQLTASEFAGFYAESLGRNLALL